jgi:hypothetical protein
MARRTAKNASPTGQLDRQCRSCRRWSTVDASVRLCPWCGSEYGRLDFGQDVVRFRSGSVPKLPKAKGQTEAVDIPKPAPGECGA